MRRCFQTPASCLLLSLFLTLGLLSGCLDFNFSPSEKSDSKKAEEPPEAERPSGATSFLSADTVGSQNPTVDPVADMEFSSGPEANSPPVADEVEGEDGEERNIEEGDIYKVLGNGLIANLNAYRGLQIIDVSDVSNPRIIGRAQMAGTPVELYAVEDAALILMNNWRGYIRGQTQSDMELMEGGVLFSVDLSDPANPLISDQAYIPGFIKKSRIAKGATKSALYIAAQNWQYSYFEPDGVMIDAAAEASAAGTVVVSFDATGGSIVQKSRLDLGGGIIDIQAASDALLTAEYPLNDEGSLVTVIDISDVGGEMKEGSRVQVSGMVENQFNMDLRNGILRVVSQGWNANHIETFDATDIADIKPVDHKIFGQNQRLFATLFLDQKAFFVTYFQQDPFHAFSIDEYGFVEEKNEFIVSGWNDYFRSAFDETRLIGVGVNDENSRNMAVSLYDITDLKNPEPLITRVEVQATGSWSEAQWDHRAFSVLDNAASSVGPNDEEETGLILLPFSGWNEKNEYAYAAQIYTFSPTSLTARGVMLHGTPVRRSFVPSENIGANLSEAELSLFDIFDPDAPEEKGRVNIAPNYTDIFVFNDHWARLETGSDYWGGWVGGSASPSKIEILPITEHPDAGAPTSSIDIPARAQTFQSGDLTIVLATEITSGGQYESEILVYDLSDPSAPQLASTISTNRLKPYYGNFMIESCFSCDMAMPWYGGASMETQDIPNGLVFLNREPHYEYVETPKEDCSMDPVSPGGCREIGGFRHWESLSLDILDLSNPSEPKFAQTIDLPMDNEGLGITTHDADVWVNFKRPAGVREDNRPHARYFIQRIDASKPSAPTLGKPINVPGELIAMEGDIAYTRDLLWGDGNEYVTSVARVKIIGQIALLQAHREFPKQTVGKAALDGKGRLIVGHTQSWTKQKMTILDAESEDFTVLAEADLNDWAELKTVVDGRALFTAPGGLLVYNLDDPTKPYPQAFFTTKGWPSKILVHDKTALLASGRHGIYSFDLNEN